MNKEINTIIANLEGCIGMFDYLLTPTESNLLVAYIKELQQENKQLKEIIKENTILVKDEYGDYQECNIKPLEMKQKYEKLKDNWNKLKEYIGTEWYSYDNDSVEFEVAKDILDKMEEMIGGDK